MEKEYPNRCMFVKKESKKKYNYICYCNNLSKDNFTLKDGYVIFHDTYNQQGCKLDITIKWTEANMYDIFNYKFKNLSIRGDAHKFNIMITILNKPFELNVYKKYGFKETYHNIAYTCIVEGKLYNIYRKDKVSHPNNTKKKKHQKRNTNNGYSRTIYTTSSYYIAHPYQGGLCTPK